MFLSGARVLVRLEIVGGSGLFHGTVVGELTSVLRRVEVDGYGELSLCIWELRPA